MPPATNSQGAGAFQSSEMPCSFTTVTEMMPSTTAPDRNENAAAATGRPRPRASCELIGAWMAMKAPDRMPRSDQTTPIIVVCPYLTSAATFSDTILSGSCTGSPRLILSTLSMPSMTWPQTVYWRLRKAASSKQMKNCELAEFGFCERAIEQVPRPWLALENSAFRSGFSEPPMPARDGAKVGFDELPNLTSPVCAIKPSMTR